MQKFKKYTYKIFAAVLCLQVSQLVFSQDIHFSQFYFNPAAFNPAQTGFFPGDYRVITNYKSQWKSITNPYKTAYASFELSLPVKRVGLALTFYNDKAGRSNIGTTKGDMMVSYTLRANASNSIGAGLQFGFGQQSVNITDLKWDSQFNGVLYDSSIPSGETFGSNAYTYLDVGGGIIWDYYNKYNQFKLNIGGAIFHANQPVQSLYGSSFGEKMPYKIVANVSSQIKLIDKQAFFLPQFLYMQQGPYSEMGAGALIKYIIGTDNASELVYVDKWTSSAVYLGGHYRFKDALVATCAIELKKSFLVGFSYDINISKLRVASELRGGMEFTIRYRGAFN